MEATLIRELKEYTWRLDGKRVSAFKKGTKMQFTFDKVRLMSFMKFTINCLDKMRIEESKVLRARIRKIKSAPKQRRLLK